MFKLTRMVAVFSAIVAVLPLTACRHEALQVDLSGIDPSLLGRCAKATGVLVVEDERYDDYWGAGYDVTSYMMLGDENTGSFTNAPTRRMPVRRQVLKILTEEGARRASKVVVEHYREKVPPIDVRLWSDDGRAKGANVQAVETVAMVDWPCENGFPRRTVFRIGPLVAGDVVEIKTPISGPNQLFWRFGSSRFCVQRSRATFGSPDDEYRPDMSALLVDASGAVKLVSAPGEYPMRFELTKPLMPISPGRVPFVLLSPHCPGWSNLRARIFKTALWLARAGKVKGRKKVNPFLVKPVTDGQIARRIAAVAGWMHSYVKVDPPLPGFWYRWMPAEPAEKTARKRHGPPGSWAALAFRILEEAGLNPRFALVHTHPRNPFDEKIRTPLQMDTLAVVVSDENGKDHWLVPGIPYGADRQPPPELAGRKALVVERYWLDREQGAGSCQPEIETIFSCQISTPEPVELKLVSL